MRNVSVHNAIFIIVPRSAISVLPYIYSQLADYGECKADLVFVFDSSSSIGLLNWFRMKQFAIDIVQGTVSCYRTQVV